MRCDVCHKNLNPDDAYDFAGVQAEGLSLRIHKACLGNATVGDLANPDYKPAEGRVSMPPKQDLPRPTGVDEQGQRIYRQPTKKADQSSPLSGLKQPSCVLCGQPATEADSLIVNGVKLYAHDRCIQAHAAKLGMDSQETKQETPMSIGLQKSKDPGRGLCVLCDKPASSSDRRVVKGLAMLVHPACAADLERQVAAQAAMQKSGGPITVTGPGPLVKSFTISKAWINPDGSVSAEGWISTNAKDIERDIVEPESFALALPDYMSRGAPVSVEHNTKTIPIGQMKRAALVRDGRIFQEQFIEPIPFQHFPNQGTGFYGLAVIYDPVAGTAVTKGLLTSFSWVGMPRKWESQSDGGRRFSEPGAIDPLMEATVTAYPINTQARMLAGGMQ